MDTILSPFMWVISWVLYGIHKGLVAIGMADGSGPAWVLSIIGLTVVVRLVILPLYNRQIKASRSTQILQPKMMKIREKYKNKKDTISQQRQAEEIQALYRKHGVSPMASCWPMLVQMPILFSLFRVLYKFPMIASGEHAAIGPLDASLADDFLNSTFFGAPMSASFAMANKAPGYSPVTIRVVAGILVVVMCLSMFWTQRQLLTKNMPEHKEGEDEGNPALRMQKYMLYGMPLIYVFSGYAFPVGVLIYWCAGNLWNMGQQAWFIRNNPTPGSKAYRQREERLARARRRKGLKEEGLSEEEIEELEQKSAAGGQRKQPMSKARAKKAGVTDRFAAGGLETEEGGETEDAALEESASADADSAESDGEARGKDGLTDEERARKRYERRQAERARAKSKRKKRRR
ncbi:stage III sporulation protein J [Actinobaculum suis]|uniref:Membrane protein insertase YidC n=1 Tax=Actinobaculum suis TaxID=1657 RepID=A0A7Z9C8S5_9ACTO|nr:membrane protein insertase YidC [Actinobaculum suis]VDG75354.1 stage III sporulation protein J [Actinobaculum suis]